LCPNQFGFWRKTLKVEEKGEKQMRKIVISLVLMLAFSFGFILPVQADEISDLKAQIKAMQQQMQAMQEKLQQLDRKGKSRTDRPEGLEERVAALEEKSKEAYQGGFASIKGAQFELGGELEMEFVATDRDTQTSKPNPHFQIDTFYLYPKVTFADYDLVLKGDIAFKTNDAFIEELYAKFSGLPANSWIEVGLNDMFIANIDRKTEAEILVETAFYRSDDMGVTLGGEPLDWLYWRTSITNGLKLGTKGPGEDGGYTMLHDARNTSDASKNLMLGVGLGAKSQLGDFGKIDVLPFYYHGSLSDADVAVLQGVNGYGTSAEDEKTRYGANVRYDIGNFTLIGQYIKGEDGRLDRTGWFVQPSYKIEVPGWNKFNAYEFVYRYNDLDVDLTNDPTDSLTWDRQQHIIALITDVYKNVKLKTEYFVNDEDTGAADVNNDEILVQLEIKF
jgi:cell division protein FtsB